MSVRRLDHDEARQVAVALLSPFDRLIHDRDRTRTLFDFEFHPRDVQAGGEASLGLVRTAGVDVRFTATMRADVEAEIEALAAWLGLRIKRP